MPHQVPDQAVKDMILRCRRSELRGWGTVPDQHADKIEAKEDSYADCNECQATIPGQARSDQKQGQKRNHSERAVIDSTGSAPGSLNEKGVEPKHKTDVEGGQ